MPSKLPAASGGMFVRSRLSRRLTERRKRTKQYVMSIFMQKLRSTVPLRGRRLTVGKNWKKQRNFVNSGEIGRNRKYSPKCARKKSPWIVPV